MKDLDSMIPRCTKPPKLFSTRNRKPRDEEKDTRFISLVCQWYWNFGVKQQVTMSELKSVGAQIATRLQIEVPPNWLSTVRKKHGVQIQPCGKTKPKNFKVMTNWGLHYRWIWTSLSLTYKLYITRRTYRTMATPWWITLVEIHDKLFTKTWLQRRNVTRPALTSRTFPRDNHS